MAASAVPVVEIDADRAMLAPLHLIVRRIGKSGSLDLVVELELAPLPGLQIVVRLGEELDTGDFRLQGHGRT